jgi:hypothetical protein
MQRFLIIVLTISIAFLFSAVQVQGQGLDLVVGSSASSIAVGGTVQFNTQVSGGSSPYTYEWDFDDVNTYKNPATSANPSHTFNLPGTHEVWVTVTDSSSDTVKGHLRIKVADDLTEYDAINDCGLIDDDSTDNGPNLRSCVTNDADGQYRIIFRKTDTGVYKFVSYISIRRDSKDYNVTVDFDTDSKVEFIGEPGVVLKFSPIQEINSSFYFNNEDKNKYALFENLGFEFTGPLFIYMISTSDMRKGEQYQVWRNCDFQNIRKVGKNNREIVIRSNFDRWGRSTGNLNYAYTNSLWKYNYIHNPWPDHSHPFYNREYWYIYYIGNYADVLPQDDSGKVGIHWRDGKGGGTGDRRHNWAIGNLFRNVPGWAVKLNTEEQSVHTSDNKINDNIIIGTWRNNAILVERSDGNTEINGNFFTDVSVGNIIDLGYGASIPDKVIRGVTVKNNERGGQVSGNLYACTLNPPDCEIDVSGNTQHSMNHRTGDPPGWYDSNGYLDPGEYEYYPPEGSFDINNGAPSTSTRTVTLNINVNDQISGMGSAARFPFKQGGLMQFSNNGVNWHQVEDYSSSHSWTLTSGDGVKTVSARFRDRDGNWGDPISDTITLTSSPDCNNGICNPGECQSCPQDCWISECDTDGNCLSGYKDGDENCGNSNDCSCTGGHTCCSNQCVLPVCNQGPDCGSGPCKVYTCNNPGTCTASCSSQDITTCSGPTSDGCCPSGCDETNDIDCTQLIISNLWVFSGLPYEWDTLAVGKDVYIDRTITYTTIPSKYLNLQYMRTDNDDKQQTANPFLSFDVNQPVTVYVAHDDRITTKPSWMSSFTDTGDDIDSTDWPRSVFSQDFPTGTVTLGGNGGSSASSMYSVIVEGQGSPSPELCNNEVDDDGDGKVDCNDEDCSADPSCKASGIKEYWSADVPLYLEGTVLPEEGTLTIQIDDDLSNLRRAWVNMYLYDADRPDREGEIFVNGNKLMDLPGIVSCDQINCWFNDTEMDKAWLVQGSNQFRFTHNATWGYHVLGLVLRLDFTHRADRNKNGCIEINELMDFIKRWKISSQDVPMLELMNAIGLWNAGC